MPQLIKTGSFNILINSMHQLARYKPFWITTILSALFLVFLADDSQAQVKFKGHIFEFKTRRAVADVRVENLRTHFTVVSDTGGRFAISAINGDRISFTELSYKTDTIYLTNLNSREIFLLLNKDNLLKEVNILNKEMNMGILATPITTPFGGNTVRYQTDANGDNRGGLKMSLPGFNGDEKKKQRDAQREIDGETQLQIAKVFSAENLQKYIPLKGQEMDNFRILYTPSIKVYHNKFNLPLYIDSCYQEFMKLPEEKRQSKEFLQLTPNP